MEKGEWVECKVIAVSGKDSDAGEESEQKKLDLALKKSVETVDNMYVINC